jgi:hypothetical protein
MAAVLRKNVTGRRLTHSTRRMGQCTGWVRLTPPARHRPGSLSFFFGDGKTPGGLVRPVRRCR